jgi:thioredoxin reductase (NADPH)
MIEAQDLAQLELFSEVEPQIVARLAGLAADVRVQAGEYVVTENESTSFYVLLSGKLEVTKRAGERETVLAVRETPGDYFGELPLLVGALSFANLRAATAARMARIEPHEFHWLVSQHPSFAARVMRTMSERVAGVQQAVLEAPFASAVVIGRRWDRSCHDLRDFLSRNHVVHEYCELDDPCARKFVPALDDYLDRCPIVKVCESGRVLAQPSLRDLAGAVGLRTAPAHDEYDLAIVGGGPAGLAAAVYGASEGLSTVLFEREAPGGQAGTSSRIENYLGFPNGLSGDDLASRAYAQAKRFGAELIVTRRVEGLHPGDGRHELTLDGGTRVGARAIVLATGVSYRRLSVEGIDRLTGAGVYYGAARTEAPATRGCDVYLVGAGNSAGQAAMYFSSYASAVTLLVRGTSVAASMSDYLIRELEGKDNVRFELETEIAGLEGKDHLEAILVRNARTGATTRRETTFVFVFIGADAETEWLPAEIARDARGYLTTGLRTQNICKLVRPWPLERDPFHLETSIPGIFAAGDVRSDSIKRCASGVGEGSMAVAFIHQYLEEAANRVATPA